MTMQGMMASLQGWHQLVLSGVTYGRPLEMARTKKRGLTGVIIALLKGEIYPLYPFITGDTAHLVAVFL